MKVHFYTLGCKVNQYDTESLKELFSSAGYDISATPTDCDVIVVNSCSVTANSNKKTRQAVRKFKRENPNAKVILRGCLPQAYPKKAKELVEADIITGTKNNKEILRLESFLDEHKKGDVFEECPITSFSEKTRAIIKIQDGCDRYCSYCIIPIARGYSRSRSLENLKNELIQIKKAGYKEVVLVGINFCCYGLDIGKTFVDAIELADSIGFDRVRIGSLEFDNISDEAIKRLTKLKSFCPHFHISLQSGCDKTLKAMNRHYTTAEYMALIKKLRTAFKDATITTDLMVGFPEETEEDFEESIEFVKKVGFEKVHVFPYSARPKTKAAQMKQIQNKIKEERTKIALEVADELRRKFLEKQIGKTVNVLCEEFKSEKNSTTQCKKIKQGVISGFTENYTPVEFKSDKNLQNEIVQVHITKAKTASCIGEL
ncbi:MAG: tRNA (N(6)-L-threonylcarbamoyladenosine(37)-C(2))-methylthiotransferase MtaB [Ruminococcaceae bacterium]|nr:tRNA (N(6)-L-threonylcarbamoyladenosine(37)-C(2))-methylthiotransferase MtaB [Oscillospiraceae bacterium]